MRAFATALAIAAVVVAVHATGKGPGWGPSGGGGGGSADHWWPHHPVNPTPAPGACFSTESECAAPCNPHLHYVCQKTGLKSPKWGHIKLKVPDGWLDNAPAPGSPGLNCDCRPCCADCDGVCGGPGKMINNSTCCSSGVVDGSGNCCDSGKVDCDGVCNGPAKPDCAGVCGGDHVRGKFGRGCCLPTDLDKDGFCCRGKDVDCAGVCGGTHVLDHNGVCCDADEAADGICSVCFDTSCASCSNPNKVYMCQPQRGGGYAKVTVPRWRRWINELLPWDEWCPAAGLVEPGTDGLDCDCHACCADCSGVCDGPALPYIDAGGDMSCCPSGVFDDHGDCCASGKVACGVCDGSCAECGDGVVDEGEECDWAGLDSDCCTSECTFASAITVCRDAQNDCDLPELCPGDAAACPSEAFKPAGTVCTVDGDLCTSDACDGHGTCVATPTCVCGDGKVDPGEPCDASAPGDWPCCHDCQIVAALPQTVCRAAASDCDVTEYCDGASPACPPETYNWGAPCDDGDECTPVTTCSDTSPSVCDGINTCILCGNGVVDPGEECDYLGHETCCTKECKVVSGICRNATGPCDDAESCTSAGVCPPDENPDTHNGETCDSGDVCTADATCQDGVCAGTTIGSPLLDGTCCLSPAVVDASGAGCCDDSLLAGDGLCCPSGDLACGVCDSGLVEDADGVCCHPDAVDCFGICLGGGIGSPGCCCDSDLGLQPDADCKCCTEFDCAGLCGDFVTDADGACCDPSVVVVVDGATHCCDAAGGEFLDTTSDPTEPICCALDKVDNNNQCCEDYLDADGNCCPSDGVDCATGLCDGGLAPGEPYCTNGGACSGSACACPSGFEGVRCGAFCGGVPTEADCLGCSGRGTCVNTPVDDPDSSEVFDCYACECETGFDNEPWPGKFCQCVGAGVGISSETYFGSTVTELCLGPAMNLFCTSDYTGLPCAPAGGDQAAAALAVGFGITTTGNGGTFSGVDGLDRTFELLFQFDVGSFGGPLMTKTGCGEETNKPCLAAVLNYEFRILSDGRVSIKTADGPAVVSTGNFPAMSTAWHHLAITYRGSTGDLSIYLDGVLDSTVVTAYGFGGANVGPLAIGSTAGFNDGTKPLFSDAAFDEVRVWATVRTQAEIAAFEVAAVDPSSPGLIFYQRLDEASGALADASPCARTTFVAGTDLTYSVVSPVFVGPCVDPAPIPAGRAGGGKGDAAHIDSGAVNQGTDDTQGLGTIASGLVAAVLVAGLAVAVGAGVVAKRRQRDVDGEPIVGDSAPLVDSAAPVPRTYGA